MLKRVLVTGIAVIGAAGAMTPAAFAGEEDPTTPPPPPPAQTVTVTTPAPPPETVTVTTPPPPAETVTITTPPPPPQTVTAPAPAPVSSTGGTGSPTPTKSTGSTSARPVTVVRTKTDFVNTSNDTGEVPSGAIQAGAGGTAGDGPSTLVAGIGSGALALLAAGGWLTLRRGRRLS
jgi:hypothetical protein